eukprot:365820-Chlamydomonas_euryale.AAC.2
MLHAQAPQRQHRGHRRVGRRGELLFTPPVDCTSPCSAAWPRFAFCVSVGRPECGVESGVVLDRELSRREICQAGVWAGQRVVRRRVGRRSVAEQEFWQARV